MADGEKLLPIVKRVLQHMQIQEDGSAFASDVFDELLTHILTLPRSDSAAVQLIAAAGQFMSLPAGQRAATQLAMLAAVCGEEAMPDQLETHTDSSGDHDTLRSGSTLEGLVPGTAGVSMSRRRR